MKRFAFALTIVIGGWCVFDVLIRTAFGPYITCSHGDVPQAYIVGLVFGTIVATVAYKAKEKA